MWDDKIHSKSAPCRFDQEQVNSVLLATATATAVSFLWPYRTHTQYMYTETIPSDHKLREEIGKHFTMQ